MMNGHGRKNKISPPRAERHLERAAEFSDGEIFMAKAGGRKKLPKEVAIINADNCTGCEACLEVCPVDCIYKVAGDSISVLQSWCEIDVERCVGS